MKRAVLYFSRGSTIRRLAFASLAIFGLLAGPAGSLAQDAGVSGIPLGPGNVNGQNGSISDPSGTGNAARLPPPPSQAVAPTVPFTVSPLVAYRGAPVLRTPRIRRTRYAKSRYNRAAVNAAVKENDRLLDRKLTSICRGC